MQLAAHDERLPARADLVVVAALQVQEALHVVERESHAGLLLTVAQRDVVDLNVLREAQVLRHFGIEVPGAGIPIVGLPGMLTHIRIPRESIRCVVNQTRSAQRVIICCGVRACPPEPDRARKAAL